MNTITLLALLVGQTATCSVALNTLTRGIVTYTIVGPADRGDDVERTVVLFENRLDDVDEGTRLELVGTLHVIRHPAAVVGGVLVEEWTEVRVEE